MTALARRYWSWMRTAPSGPRSDWAAVLWWERRRLPYNVFLVALGLPSLALYAVAVRLATGTAPLAGNLAWWAVAVWLAANGVYTCTWLFELKARQFESREVRDPALYAFLIDALLLLTSVAFIAPSLWWAALAVWHLAHRSG